MDAAPAVPAPVARQPGPARQQPDRRLSLLIEGWRGINHSFCLVNQHQILELLQMDGPALHLRDLPMPWSRDHTRADLPPHLQHRIDALPPPGDAGIDCIYRIAFPFFAGLDDDTRKTLTFMVTEFGLGPGHFAVPSARQAFYTRGDNAILTPSRWSRDRLAEFGFPADRLHVVPHGVDTGTFHPSSPGNRTTARASLGLREDEAVFLNIGAPFWNKGIDLVLIAFATLRRAGRRVRLVLKDQRALYGFPMEKAVQRLGTTCPALLHPDTLAAITIIPGNLSPARLRTVHSLADAYVSPYRAEGFNLPVLEAIACGTPVIVTAGGATDDFCRDGVALRIPGRLHTRTDMPGIPLARHIEPDLPALIDAMDTITPALPDPAPSDPAPSAPAPYARVRESVTDAFNWRRAAGMLTDLAR